ATAVVLTLQLQTKSGFHSGRAALQVDQAGEGVGSVARALRSHQDFHLFHIVEHGGGADAGKVHTVDQHAYRGVEGAGILAAFADAADLVEARARAARGEVHVRRVEQQLFEVQGIAAGDQCLIKHAGAGGQVLQRAAAEVGGDDDFLDGGLRLAGGRKCAERAGKGKRNGK